MQRKLRYCAAALAGAGCLAFTMGGTAGAQVDEDSGGASGALASVDLPGPLGTVDLPPVPNVDLPPLGGTVQDTVSNLSVPGVAGASVLAVSSTGTTGPGGSVSSESEVVGADVAASTVTADVIGTSCLSDESGSTGDSALANAAVAGTPVSVAPPANTAIPVPGVGTVTLNEQTTADAPGSTSIVVNAVHVELAGVAGDGDVIVSQSRCGVAGATVLGDTVDTLPDGADLGDDGLPEAAAAAGDAIGATPNLAG